MERDRHNRSRSLSDHVLDNFHHGIRGVCRCINDGKMQNFDIETENLGVRGAMVIQWEKYPKITGKFVTGRKKALYKFSLSRILSGLRAADNFYSLRLPFVL